jgi:hypothetical protein
VKIARDLFRSRFLRAGTHYEIVTTAPVAETVEALDQVAFAP